MGKGKVILLGAGPGDPGLLTIRGKEYIEQADCIIYDRLSAPELLAYAKKTCEMIYAGKENHHHTLNQEEINELLYRKAMEYPLTVRLKGGDPYVFGRGGEEALYLTERSIGVEIVPGISSAIAVPAAAGIPVTHRGIARGFQVITAHSRKDAPAEIDYSKLTDPEITYIFLMGLSSVGEIAEGLMKAGRSADTPAAVISHGTTAGQRTCVGTLADIEEKTKTAELTSPALIVVGDVVTLSEELGFQEHRPLHGRSYLVPYIGRMEMDQNQDEGNGHTDKKGHWAADPDKNVGYILAQDSELASMLRENGAEVTAIKIGQIVCRQVPEEELREALHSDWLVFTSRNGVNAFAWNLKKLGLDARAAGGAKLAAVGTSTAAELNRYFLQADLVPDLQNGKALAGALKESCRPGEKITLLAGKESGTEIADALKDNYIYNKVVVYENCGREDQKQGQAERENNTEVSETEDIGMYTAQTDGIFFTSASAVRRTVKLLQGKLPGKIYSIGPKCSEEIIRQGFRHFAEAEEASYRGLLECVMKDQSV